MIDIEIKRKSQELRRIREGVARAAAKGVEKALKDTSALAVRLAPRSVGRCIQVELLEAPTGAVRGRVYTNTGITSFAPYVEFGTGVKVDDQGNPEAIRLKRAKSIPWYIHVSMVPRSFARYGYPLVTGKDGAQYWVVDGMYPHPYFHPAAFQRRDENLEAVQKELIALVTGGAA